MFAVVSLVPLPFISIYKFIIFISQQVSFLSIFSRLKHIPPAASANLLIFEESSKANTPKCTGACVYVHGGDGSAPLADDYTQNGPFYSRDFQEFHAVKH